MLTESEAQENEVRVANGYPPKAFYRNKDRVIIYGLGDGKEYLGTVCGKSFVHVMDSYIVRLDDPGCFPGNEWECIAITEGCLRPAT